MPRLAVLATLSAAVFGTVAARAGAAPAETSPAAHPEPAKEGGAGKPGEKAETPAPPAVPVRSDRYVHHWLKLPPFAAVRLPGETQEQVEAQPGRVLVVVFIASWCPPCQQLMPELQRMQARFGKLNTDVVYVFNHDTRDDAIGFMKEFHLESGYLANYDVLKTYHNPELPTIYVGDRRGWLTTRYVKAGAKELTALTDLLGNLTAY